MSAIRSSITSSLRHAFNLPLRPSIAILPPTFLLPRFPLLQTSSVSTKPRRKAPKKKKKGGQYTLADLSRVPQFALLDAMRYLKASEVGRTPTSSKYELHLRLRTLKNGPVTRGRIKLPHSVKADTRVAVICRPDSPAATAARSAGATMVGEEEVFAKIRDAGSDLGFDRLICHTDSLPSLTKAGLGRVLGPKGLMPSIKLNTVVKDVGGAVRSVAGALIYRERQGVVSMSVGHLGFTPEELQKNIKFFVAQVRKDCSQEQSKSGHHKEVHEVVLSSTNGPGMTLNGEFKSVQSLASKELAVN